MLFSKVAPVVVDGNGANRSCFKIGLGTLRAGAGLLGESLVSTGDLVGGVLATLRDVSGMVAGASGCVLTIDVKMLVICRSAS